MAYASENASIAHILPFELHFRRFPEFSKRTWNILWDVAVFTLDKELEFLKIVSEILFVEMRVADFAEVKAMPLKAFVSSCEAKQFT